MVSISNRIISATHFPAMKSPDWIYPVYFRDKFNLHPGSKKGLISKDISGFYEIYSIKSVFQPKNKAEIKTICT
nr:hypothetical protein [Bacteroidota bacterium]